MTQSRSISDREYDKFVDSPTRADKSAVEVVVGNDSSNPVPIEGEFESVPSGLRNGGRHTIVSVNNTSWTALPASALTDRNAIAIQNNSDQDVKVNYDNTVAGYEGMTIRSRGGERQYDIKDTIVIYAKSKTGTVNLDIEELS